MHPNITHYNHIRKTPKKGWIYFILCRDMNVVKIGSSTILPAHRLEQIQTYSPCLLTLVAVCESDYVIYEEHCLQLMFGLSQMHGEWFTFTPAIQEWIKTNAECVYWSSYKRSWWESRLDED